MTRRRAFGFSVLAVFLASASASADVPGDGSGPSDADLVAISARINRKANWRRYDENGKPIPQAIHRPGDRVEVHGLGVAAPASSPARQRGPLPVARELDPRPTLSLTPTNAGRYQDTAGVGGR